MKTGILNDVFYFDYEELMIGDKKMRIAYQLINSLLRDRLRKEDEQYIEIINSLTENDIFIIDGEYDFAHVIFEFLKIKFKLISPTQFLKTELTPNKVIFINSLSNFYNEGINKINTFVKEGGVVISSDWSLKHVIQKAFPNFLSVVQEIKTQEQNFRIEITDRTNPVLRGFNDEISLPVWWLDSYTYLINVLDKDKVKILIKSKDLAEKYGNDVVTVSFDYGKGTVYHTISHFYIQRTQVYDKIHKSKATEYAALKGGISKTRADWKIVESNYEELNYASVQSALTSVEFFIRIIVNYFKRKP